MKPRIRFFLALALTGLFATVALAAGPGAVRKRAESSTLVAGTIDIEQDGTVSAHRIDQPEKLLPQVVGLIDRVVPRWRFEPVLIEGRPVRARAKMHVRVVLNRMGEDTYQLRIGSVTFFDEQRGAKGEAIVIAGAMTPPKYPTDADMTGVQGTVYLVLKIDRQGQVTEVVDEQVNLTVLGSDRQMEKGRAQLARAARVAAKKWRFDVPVRGPLADRDHWSIRIPVSFALCDGPEECRAGTDREYGSWETYIPGPKQRVPWITEQESRTGSDAMVAGQVYPVGTGPKLLTPLAQG